MSAVMTKKNDTSEQLLPWYRYGWPWFLIGIPFVSICLGGVMLYLAFNANNSLVVDDYYKEGKAYNLRVERDRLASVLSLEASLTQTLEGLILQLDLGETLPMPESLVRQARTAREIFTLPSQISLRWVHVTQAEKDGQATMSSIGAGRFIAQGATLPEEGKFRLHIEPSVTQPDNDWRLIGRLQGFSKNEAVTVNAPQPAQVFLEHML